MFAIIMIVTNTVGSVPLLVAIMIKSGSNPAIFSQFAASHGNLSLIGIGSTTGFLLMLFPFFAGLAIFIILVKPIHGRTFLMTINGTGSFRWRRFFISGLVWFFLSFIYMFVYLRIDPANFTINNKTASLILLSLLSVLCIPFQATFEEILFRGYLMQGFAVLVRNRWFPLILTSVLFGLMHSFNPEVRQFGFLTMIPQYIVFGLTFGIITLVDDGTEASMGAHSANNIFLCIMLTNKSSALQTPALYEQINIHPWTEFIALLITGVVFIITLKMIFRWDKLSIIFGKIHS